MSYRFSKSRYCSGVQCPKILWLKKNKPELFDNSVMNETILNTGNEVGDLAMGLLGDFAEVPFSENLSDMIPATQKLLDNGVKNIAEASFSFDNCFCSVDILKNLGNNRVELYEVKSSTSVKDIYKDDVAYQNYVLTKLGFQVEKVCLVHINNQYVRQGDIELEKFFILMHIRAKLFQKRFVCLQLCAELLKLSVFGVAQNADQTLAILQRACLVLAILKRLGQRARLLFCLGNGLVVALQLGLKTLDLACAGQNAVARAHGASRKGASHVDLLTVQGHGADAIMRGLGHDVGVIHGVKDQRSAQKRGKNAAELGIRRDERVRYADVACVAARLLHLLGGRGRTH